MTCHMDLVELQEVREKADYLVAGQGVVAVAAVAAVAAGVLVVPHTDRILHSFSLLAQEIQAEAPAPHQARKVPGWC